MNKTFEPLRGSWIARDLEIAEANRDFVRSVADQIPAEIRETILAVVKWADDVERCCDLWNDAVYKAWSQEIQENMFLDEQIKGLFQAIRATKDPDSIHALRVAARGTCERIREWKYKAEQERLQLRNTLPPPRPSPPPRILSP